MKKKNKPSLELIKSIDEVDFIAQLVLSLLNTEKTNYLFLQGEIGSGKTTLVKSIAKILNETKDVISPTFNKMIVYDKFVHIDAYNMKGQSIESFEDYWDSKIVIIEWVENLVDNFNEGFVIDIKFIDEKTRKYTIFWKE